MRSALLLLLTTTLFAQAPQTKSTMCGTTEIAATVRVNYVEQPKYGLWLPSEMEEEYLITQGAGQPLAAACAGRKHARWAVDVRKWV